MDLLQISEPELKPVRDMSGYAVGIDLGTTNSVVACLIAGKAKILGPVLPSVHQDIRSIKRLMGTDQRVEMMSPVEISSYILAKLKKQAEDILGEDVTKSVITVPAYFDDAARSATKAAANLAGLEVLRLINEPTAAAVAYGLDNDAEGIYLIYDFGGGTFDVSILRMQKGVFQVLATGGDRHLGGDDIDHAVMRHLNLSEDDYLIAREVKEALSHQDNWVSDHGSLSKEEFEKIAHEFIGKTIDICNAAIDSIKLDREEIKEIVLVGGSTRIPLVRKMITEAIKKPLDNIDPDMVVAMGAAIQADALIHGSDNLLLDVTSLSIGLEVMGGMNERIIHKNSTIPLSVTKKFTTYQDNQTGISFHIVQGEREMVQDCRSLAKFELKGIPPMKASLAKVAVTFTVDADGLLTVAAKEESSGVHQEIEVRPSYGLTEVEVEEMLVKAYANAKQDMDAKALAKLRFKAQSNIKHITQAINEDDALLSEEEKVEILGFIEKLESIIDDADLEKLESANQNLEDKSSKFLQDKLNHQLTQALQGRAV
jgi:molecular chaperone HscA